MKAGDDGEGGDGGPWHRLEEPSPESLESRSRTGELINGVFPRPGVGARVGVRIGVGVEDDAR